MRYLKLFLNRPRYLVLLLLLKTLGQKLRYPSVAVLVTIAAVSYALWHKKMIPSPVP